MNIHNPSHLNLLFPQWQGSGLSNILYHAANTLAAACPDINLIPVPVPKQGVLQVSNNILGYEAIVSQLILAKKIMEEKNPASVLVIGGDCGIELAPVSFMNKKYGNKLALVWLDAHADLNTPASSPSKHFHGMPLRALCGQGDPGILGQCFSFLSPNQILLAGAREFDPAEQTFIQDHGVTQVRVHEMAADPTALVRAIHKKGAHHVYIHIDMDVLDPGDYPHVKHPTPHGLMADTLEKIIAEIAASFHVAGAGLMEFTTDRMAAGGNSGLARLKALMDLFR